MVGLLVGVNTRKGRNEPQRAIGGQGGAQHKLNSLLPWQTQSQPLIPIQLTRHPQTPAQVSPGKSSFPEEGRSPGLKRKLQPFIKANPVVSFPFLLPQLHQSQHHLGG